MKKVLCLVLALLMLLPFVVACADNNVDTPADTTTAAPSAADTTAAPSGDVSATPEETTEAKPRWFSCLFYKIQEFGSIQLIIAGNREAFSHTHGI